MHIHELRPIVGQHAVHAVNAERHTTWVAGFEHQLLRWLSHANVLLVVSTRLSPATDSTLCREGKQALQIETQ